MKARCSVKVCHWGTLVAVVCVLHNCLKGESLKFVKILNCHCRYSVSSTHNGSDIFKSDSIPLWYVVPDPEHYWWPAIRTVRSQQLWQTVWSELSIETRNVNTVSWPLDWEYNKLQTSMLSLRGFGMSLSSLCSWSPGAQATGEAIGEGPAFMRTAFKNIRATQTLVSLAHHQYIFFY